MSIWKIPTPVRKIFDSFPLKVNEPTELPSNGTGSGSSTPVKGSTHVYVYNVSPKDGICTDPHCLEVQSWLKLRNRNNEGDDEITLSAASVHVSALDTLPYIVEHSIGNSTARQKTNQSVSRLQYLTGESSAKEDVYCSLIETWLRSCWVVTMLDPRNCTIKDSIYILEEDRKELPSLVLSVLSNQISYRLIQELEPQYPQLTAEATSYRARIVGYCLDSSIVSDVFDRAQECLNIFNDILANNNDSPFLGNLADKTTISRLDVLLFSYTHLILDLLPDSQLGKLIPARVRSHAEAVYNEILQ